MVVKERIRIFFRKAGEFVFDRRTLLLFLASMIAFLTPFLAASGSEAASSEYLATLIAHEATANTESKVLNVNYATIPSETPVTRAEVSSLCSAAHTDSTYKYVEMEYNARVLVNENIGDYVRVDSFQDPETSLVLSNAFTNHTNPKGEIIFDVFELKLMFPKTNTGFSGFDNFCYIRQEDADYLIQTSDGLYQDYEDLIDEPLPVRFLGSEASLEWKIANIMFSDNEVYRHFNTVIGPWALCYIYLPSYECCSFNFDYAGSVRTNEGYLETYRDRFGGKNFTIAVTTRDILDKDASAVLEIEDLILGAGDKGYPAPVTLAISFVALIPLVVSLVLLRKFVCRHAGGVALIMIATASCLYEGFSLSYLASPLNVIYFTSQGMLIFLVLLLAGIGTLFLVRVSGGREP